MSTLDHLPAGHPCTAHLDAGHAHILLDALSTADALIQRGHRPWAAHGTPDPSDAKTTEAGYLELFASAVRVPIAVVDAEPGSMLVRHTREAAHACAALNLHTSPSNVEAGDRSPRTVVDRNRVSVDVARRADHMAIGDPSARLTVWQAVKQSWLIHPDWTVADHLIWLHGDGYDTGSLCGGTPQEVICRWLDEHRRCAPADVTAPREAQP